jgi:hypothetical protein
MKIIQRIETPLYRFQNTDLQGWLEAQTHPRWNNIRVKYDIDSFDWFAETNWAI